MSKDVFVTWDDIHNTVMSLSDLIREQSYFSDLNGIIGVARGGWVPAAMLAQALDIRQCLSISMSSYDFKDSKSVSVFDKPALAEGGENWLIVDDLVDSGKSFDVLRKFYPKAHFVSLYAKPVGKPKTDLFVQEFAQDEWIHLPWELGDCAQFEQVKIS